MVDGNTRTDVPARRVIILGASNVVLGLPSLVETARNAWGQPLDILAATGHGRSFGLASTVLGRTLPGIVRCGIWEALRERPPAPTAALVTDIGNDLLYGAQVATILRWLEQCLERLAPQVQRLVVTRLPLESLAAAPEWKIRLLTSLFFPGSHINRDAALVQAVELDQQLLTFARRYGAYVVQPHYEWYGWDPIHIARRHRAAAWRAYLTCWSNGQPPARATASWHLWLLLQRARPQQRKLFGMERCHVQPTVKLVDGSTISLY